MPSSISSSDSQLPTLPWGRVLGAAVLVFACFVAFMEIRLARLGYQPTMPDSRDAWVRERVRASQLGERALILIGASRIQLGIDLDVLRQQTGLEPVQLAIDGTSFVPILAGLAADPAIRGTVLVDYYNGSVIDYGNVAQRYQKSYEMAGSWSGDYSPSSMIEKILTARLHNHMRSYADGATPFLSFGSRVLTGKRQSQYLIMLPDRSRISDYSLVTMPDFYYERVSHELGEEWIPSPDAPTLLAHKIALVSPNDNRRFLQHAKEIGQMVSAIKARSGRVLFVAMPMSGMVKEIEERRFPRAQFWDRFVKEVGAPAVRSADNPLLNHFTCPDGSHLDMRSRPEFTTALTRTLGLGRLDVAQEKRTPLIK